MGTGMGIEGWGSVRNGVNDKQHYIMSAMETFCVFFGQTIKNRFEFVFEFEFKVW